MRKGRDTQVTTYVMDSIFCPKHFRWDLNKKFRYKRSLAWPLTASVVIQPRWSTELRSNLRGHVPNFTYARDFQFSKATVYQYSKE